MFCKYNTFIYVSESIFICTTTVSIIRSRLNKIDFTNGSLTSMEYLFKYRQQIFSDSAFQQLLSVKPSIIDKYIIHFKSHISTKISKWKGKEMQKFLIFLFY